MIPPQWDIQGLPFGNLQTFAALCLASSLMNAFSVCSDLNKKSFLCLIVRSVGKKSQCCTEPQAGLQSVNVDFQFQLYSRYQGCGTGATADAGGSPPLQSGSTQRWVMGGPRRGKFTPSCQWGGHAWSLHAWINTIKRALALASPTPFPPFLPCDASPFPPHPPPFYNSIWPGHAARWHTVGQKGSNDELLPVGVIHDDNY